MHQVDYNAPEGYDAYIVNINVQNAENVGESIGTDHLNGSPGCNFNTKLKSGFSNEVDFTTDNCHDPQHYLAGETQLTINQDGTAAYYWLDGSGSTAKGTLTRQ